MHISNNNLKLKGCDSIMKKIWKEFHNENGAALIWMLIVFTVSIILLNSIIFLTRQDIKETVNLEERIQTYYIAASGIDLTYAALMDPSYSPKKIEAAISKLGSNVSNTITDTINVMYDGVLRGTANVTIRRVTIDEVKWIQITSVGKLVDKNTKVTTSMRINEDNTNQIVREKFAN